MILRETARLPLGGLDKKIARVYVEINGNQSAPAAGAGDTLARFDNKKCAMVSALDHAAAAVEELVCNPFQRNSQVWAAVLVQVDFVLQLDCKQFAFAYLKTFASALGDFINCAQADCIR